MTALKNSHIQKFTLPFNSNIGNNSFSFQQLISVLFDSNWKVCLLLIIHFLEFYKNVLNKIIMKCSGFSPGSTSSSGKKKVQTSGWAWSLLTGLCAVSSAADYRQIYVFIKSRDSYRTTESALPWLYRMFYCPTTSVSLLMWNIFILYFSVFSLELNLHCKGRRQWKKYDICHKGRVKKWKFP